jgi:hypothetical protein
MKSVFTFLTVLFSIFYFLPLGADAQPFGNEWIVNGQVYHKIKVNNDAIYRIRFATLDSLFPNVSTLDARGFKLYYRGQEQAILVNTGTDNFINSNADYIDFFGRKNDGATEAELYQPASLRYNKYESIYSDTSVYFLTHSPGLDGKRMRNVGLINNVNVPFELFKIEQQFVSFKQFYLPGRGLADFQSKIHSSYINDGEGFAGPRFDESGIVVTMNGFNGVSSAGPDPELEMLCLGRGFVEQKVQIQVGAASQTILTDTVQMQGYTSGYFKAPFSRTHFASGQLRVFTRMINRFVGNSISFIRVRYPTTFELPNNATTLQFWLRPNPNNYSRLRFSNVFQMELYDITDVHNVVRVGVANINGEWIAGVENTATERNLILTTAPVPISARRTQRFEPQVFNPALIDYVMVTHPSLLRATSGVSAAQQYADYRRSPQGGGHNVLLISVNQVYDQFGFGEYNPLAIRKMMDFMLKNGNPKYLLLMGKALTINERTRVNTDYFADNLVPTLGFPASDALFTIGLNNSGAMPAVPTGRINAATQAQLLAYLNKVKQHENIIAVEAWRKNLLLISGGISTGEQLSFRNFVNRYAEIAQGPYLGGNTRIINKISNQLVEFVDIREQINAGLSMITLFGHSSAVTSDVDIGRPSDPFQGYNNFGKYPVILVNGCLTGNIFSRSNTQNEDWVLTPDKGAVAFISHTDQGLPSFLNKYTTEFYKVFYADSNFIGKPYGVCEQEMQKRYLAIGSATQLLDSLMLQQMLFHGDPAIKIFPGDKPDYATNNSSVFSTNVSTSSAEPSYRIGAVVTNFGKFIRDSVIVQVRRRLASGQVVMYNFKVRPLNNVDTLFFDLAQNTGENFAGINRFEVILDPFDLIKETNENNNVGVFEISIPGTSVNPLFPRDYGIVADRAVRLIAQATDLKTTDRRYIFELDTSYYFNSPLRRISPPIQAGNLATWSTTLPLSADSIVYFWRVRFFDIVSPQDTAWQRSSFIYVNNGHEGWNQSNFLQFIKAQDVGVVKDFSKRMWDFPESTLSLEVKCSGAGPPIGQRPYEFKLNGVPMLRGAFSPVCFLTDQQSFISPGRILMVAIDRNTLKPYVVNYMSLIYFSACGRAPEVITQFWGAGGWNNLRNVISTKVNVGDYVLLFTTDRVPYSALTPALMDSLGRIGLSADSLMKLKDGDPFIAFGQKYATLNPGAAIQILPKANAGPTEFQVLEFSKVLNTFSEAGFFTTTTIGPALEWKKLFASFNTLDPQPGDKNGIEIYGIEPSGKDSLLFKASDLPWENDISFIDAATFPSIKMRVFLSDPVFKTPPQPRRLMVTYVSPPEGTMNINAVSNSYVITPKQEGEQLNFDFAFSNIGNKDFPEPLAVHYLLNNNLIKTDTIGTLKKDSTLFFKLNNLSTIGNAGTNNLTVFVNPRLQPEEYYENNVLSIPFEVRADRQAPVLDVAFDGVRIMDGDIVSPRPTIQILLKDENKFRLKQDTLGIEIILSRQCDGCMPERIAFTDPRLRYTPAGAENDFRIELTPGPLEDGKYQLSVQGTDASGNQAGFFSYRVAFTVINKSSITNFYPYPNPFSTSTRFVFTITGSEIPEDFIIQIMTISGKVVREITKAELGNIRIGNNISEYRWNGTDEFGDRLANGIYLYRVVFKQTATNFEHRSTAADDTFKKGFGKLYIMR